MDRRITCLNCELSTFRELETSPHLERLYEFLKVNDLRLGIFHPSYDKHYVLRMPYLENEVKTLMELRSESLDRKSVV